MDTLITDSNVMQSVRMLLAGSIDYAGLFPPAGLSMSEAVINYATYRSSNYNWMLGRFIVMAGRLHEFYENASELIPKDGADPWRVSVVVAEDVVETMHRIKNFNSKHGPGVVCDVVEIKVASQGEIANAVASLPGDVTAYFEITPDENLPDLIATLALNGQRAKIRTGGVTPDAFPTSKEIIRFVRTCLAANVPFKATAGLHHPIRCFRPLTYQKDAVKGTMHGFLNVFMMTGFAREGFKVSFLEDVMEEEFGEVFRFGEHSITWRDDFSLNLLHLERLRKLGIQSFGSCSFDEPVSDLQKLGIL
ncbi:MAG: hypothetical protein IPL32_10605 [Chloracidobacterium sp.]|nr:hypothetical protein [Chloracidobacterium sp.]